MDPSSSAMDLSPDPVSLRAAALSTLKLKRRKLAPEKVTPMPPFRPTPVSDFQLDYGQEDVMVVDPQPTPSPKPSPNSAQKAPIIYKDVQMREEGEISDEEEILRPAFFLKRSPPQQPSLRQSKSPIPVKALSPQPAKVAEVKSGSPLHKPLVSEERAPLSLLERFYGYVPSVLESETVGTTPDAVEAKLDTTLSLLGPDRVRPGLFLTMDEYDTAKDIILDLLGWGVPPDLLVNCGLTKELVFYVFTELNLRLPDNFDSSGIIPFTPELFPQFQQSVLVPPPPLAENTQIIVDTVVEITPKVTTPPLRPAAIASWDSPSNTDLHDMERQRRQELLARKAVQASRKLKQSTSIDTPPSISQSNSSSSYKQDPSMGAAIPTEVIEDFLNSIDPVRDPAHLNGVLPPPSNDDQDMNDTQIIVIPRHSPASASTDDLAIPRAQSHGPPLSSSVPSISLPETNLTVESSSPLSPSREATYSRRGVRPVASDFVDVDPASRSSESKSRLEPAIFSSGIIRRLNLTANFRDIGSRRCVIDLSDSEDDDEEEVKDQLQQSQLAVEGQPWRKRDRRSKAGSYHPAASIKALSGNQSPAALMMKELEIRHMRGLIAKREEEMRGLTAKREEETRLKKLASTKSSINIDTNGSSTPVSNLYSLKQEDVDVVMNPDSSEQNGFGSYQNSESATSPPRSVSKSPDDQDANRIQNDPLNLDPHSFQDLASEAQEAHVIATEEQQQLVQQKEQQPAIGHGMVDADPEPSPSTQVNQKTTSAILKQDANELVSEIPTAFNDNNRQQSDVKYGAYDSIFELYPLLRGGSEPISPNPNFSFQLSSHPSLNMFPLVQTSSASVLAKPSSYFLSASSSSSLPELNLRGLKLAAIGKVLHPFKKICRYEVPGGGTCRDEGCEDMHLSRLQGATVEPSDQDLAEYLFNTLPRGWLTHHQVSSASKIFTVLQELRGHSSLEDRVDQALLTLGSYPT